VNGFLTAPSAHRELIMKSFKDSAGRIWSIAVTVASLKRVLADGVNLLEPDHNLYARLMADSVFAAGVAWSFVRIDAEKIGVTQRFLIRRSTKPQPSSFQMRSSWRCTIFSSKPAPTWRWGSPR
jgi:hypothetical protein